MQGKDQTIFQYVEQEKRIFGGTLDEVVPIIVLVVFLVPFGHPYIALLLSGIWFYSMRRIKKGLGSKYLVAVVYWYLPALKLKGKEGITYKTFFVKTPPAEQVHWI